MNNTTNISTNSIPNFRTKNFCFYISELYENIETDFLTFKKIFENYEYTYIDYESRDKNFYVWRAFTNHTEFRLKDIKKTIQYLVNNYNEVKEKIGLNIMSNDNKYLYEEMNKINEDMKTYKNQISSKL
jgi:hypothetical protein